MVNRKTISTYCLILSFLIPANILAQSANNKVVGKVGAKEITYNELKNNLTIGNGEEFTLPDLQSFLPLYLDYVAKLQFAKDEGYYSDSSIVAEHKAYSKQAAYAHWINQEVRPVYFETFYERAQKELKAFHILITPPENASPEDIEAIKAKLQQAKTDIENGVDLETVNRRYSTVRSGTIMGGDLPWITAGRTVQPFEEELYKLKPGQISEPVKTEFGYHLILMQDIRDRTPAKKVSHIFVRSTQNSAAADKINKAYAALEKGVAWNEVLNEFTEDGYSAPNGGNIGWISYNSNYMTSFLDQVRQLDATVDYSEPVNSVYGFHIFKVDSVQTFKSEEHRKQIYMQDFNKSNYLQQSNEFVVNYLQKKFDAQKYDDAFNDYASFINNFDSKLIDSITLNDDLAARTVYEFNEQKYSLEDYHAYITQTHGKRVSDNYANSWLNDFSQYVIDQQIIDLTTQFFPDFGQQLSNYLNGLVIYEVNDDYMWSAASVDSSRLKNIYENNTETYRYEKRPYFYLLSASRDSLLTKAINFIEEGNSPDSLKNFDKRIAVSSDSIGTYREEPFLKLTEMEPNSFSEIFEYNNRKAVFFLKDWLPARRMTFEESFNRLLAEFQPEREKEWLEQLRKQYKVEANTDNLETFFQTEMNK